MTHRLPKRVRLDICTACQLKCKDCYMRKSNYGTVGKGYTTAEQFKEFLKRNPFIQEIEISNSGEIFLNPDFEKILEIAYNNKIKLTANNGVNLNSIKETAIEKIVKFQLYSLNISLDGASDEVYKTYRINGKFNKVIANIELINKYKEIYHSNYPLLNWQYIVMDTTQDINEIKRAKKLAKQLNMSISFKKTWNESFIPINSDLLEKETKLSFSKETPFSFNWIPCLELWNSPQINWDGRLLGCCCVYLNDFKCNVFNVGLEKALKSKEVRYAKRLLTGKCMQDNTIDIPCNDCPYYLKMKKNKNFISST